MTTYSPNNILLPKTLCDRHAESLSLTYGGFVTIDTKLNKVLADDCYPLIHDVFRTTDNTRLIALDSAWHKLVKYEKTWAALKKELLPLKISCNGQPLKYQYHKLPPFPKHYSQLGIYEMALSAELSNMSVIRLDFEWQGFKQSVNVPVNPFATLDKTPFTLHTMQKDNPLVWIKDWCLYYHREHSVNRIVIYDNASDDEAGLVECLESINDPIEFIWIRWSYNYFKNFNRCQHTGLNHCLALLGDSSQYYLNFDIDEYLVNTTALCLHDYLKQADTTAKVRRQCYYSIPQHRVANYPKKPILNRLPRASDFEYKLRLSPYTHPKAINIYARIHSKGMGTVDIHATSLGNDSWVRWALKKIKNTLLKIFIKLFNPTTKQDLYFNHYKGLTLGRMRPERRKQLSLAQLSKDCYTVDTVMPAKLRKHGLMPEED